MNPNLQEILHNITSRLAVLEQNAESDKLLIDLIQEQRKEIDKLRKHWIDLTDEEMVKDMKDNCDSYEMRGAFVNGWKSAEAKLKEKNGG